MCSWAEHAPCSLSWYNHPPKSSISLSRAPSCSWLNSDMWLSLPPFTLLLYHSMRITFTLPPGVLNSLYDNVYISCTAWSYYHIAILCYCFSSWVLLIADVFSQEVVSYSNTSLKNSLWDLNDSQQRNMLQTHEAYDIHAAAFIAAAERPSHTRKLPLRHVYHHKTKGRVNGDWAHLWPSFKYHKKKLIGTRFSPAGYGVTLHLLYSRWHT